MSLTKRNEVLFPALMNEIDNAVLTVSSETKEDKEESKENFTRREFKFSSFKRAFTLPETVATDKIEAAYIDGVLKFNLPKKEEALTKPKRKIELS